jgi:hypothetical protein
MNALAKKALVAVAGLAIVAAPLAASAQSFHGNDRGRPVERGPVDRGRIVEHRDTRYRVSYARPVYHAPYFDGYFGLAPAGWQGYYWHGNWYRHRRMSAGLWIYF